MDTENNESQTSFLTDDIIQKIIGKTMIEMGEIKDQFFDVFFRMNEKPSDEVLSVAQTAIEVITRVKVVEITVLGTLSEFMKSQDVPAGSTKLLHYLCKDVVITLLLLNEMFSPEELLDVYSEEELKTAFGAFKMQQAGLTPQKTDLHTLSEELKTLMGKIRETQSSTT